LGLLNGNLTFGGTNAYGTPASITLTNATGLPLGGMANLAANSFIGNNTGSPTTPLALTIAQSKSLLAIACGDLTNATVLCSTAPGTGVATFLITPSGANLASALTSALTVPAGGTGAGTFIANAPLIGNTTGAIGVGTRSGNTTSFATTSGTLTNGHCTQIDASGNIVDSGSSNCGGGGSTAWSAISNAAGALTLANGTNATTFNQTNATVWTWANTTAAVVGTSQSSPIATWCGTAFHGSASVQDCLTLQNQPGNGNDAAITFAVGHTGTSTGTVTTTFPGPITATSVTSNGSSAGMLSLTNSATPSSVVANSWGWTGNASTTTSWYGQNPNASPVANQIMLFPAPTSSVSQWAWTTFSSTNLTDTASLVRNNAANTYTTGAQDFTSATSILVSTQTASDNSTKAASTAYVTTGIANAIAAVDPAVAVQAASAAVLPNTPTYSNGVAGVGATLTSATNSALVVDGYTVLLNDRVLVKNQATAANNGVYTQTTLGVGGSVAWVLTRATDFNSSTNMNNTGAIPVVNGTANASTQWLLTSKVTTVGTDAVTFTEFALNPTTLVTTTATPSAGVGHFAGSTQTITSSAVNLAGGSTEVTGVLPTANIAVALANQTSINGLGITASTGTLTIANAKTLTASNTLEVAGSAADNGGVVWSNASGYVILAHTTTANLPLLSGNAATPAWAAITYPTSATSGGVPYFSSTTAMASSAAGTAKQLMLWGGAGSAPTAIDFPERYMIPFANCNNTTAAAGVSIGSGGTVTCRAGTNNLGGYVSITDTASTFAQFQISIPTDWDTATNPYISFAFISVTDTTNGHTVIPQIKVSCPTATNGTVTDDHAFAAAHSATTVTFGASAVANGFYTTSVQMNSTDMTGCVAGGMMIVQVGRATDTATGTIGFEYADVTFPRLLVVQAN
jgi:hypothetical protein